MSWFRKVAEWFLRDSSERRKFLMWFNDNAKKCFVNLSVDSLLEASSGSGRIEYRHELSAPSFASGLIIDVKAGKSIPVDDIIIIGTFILASTDIVRKIYVLHWDTLIIRDSFTGKSVDWAIKEFINMGGLLDQIRNERIGV